MSYDLMVFEKSKAPIDSKEFMAWFQNQVEWGEDHDYETISVSSQKLQDWFMEFKETFPAMNGPFAVSNDLIDDSHVTDYCIGHDVIYSAFGWSVAEEAYRLMRELAKKHDVGFFDVSGDGEIFY